MDGAGAGTLGVGVQAAAQHTCITEVGSCLVAFGLQRDDAVSEVDAAPVGCQRDVDIGTRRGGGVDAEQRLCEQGKKSKTSVQTTKTEAEGRAGGGTITKCTSSESSGGVAGIELTKRHVVLAHDAMLLRAANCFYAVNGCSWLMKALSQSIKGAAGISPVACRLSPVACRCRCRGL